MPIPPLPENDWTQYQALVLSELTRLANSFEKLNAQLQGMRLEVSRLQQSIDNAETSQAVNRERFEDHEQRLRKLEKQGYETEGQRDYLRWAWPVLCSAATAIASFFLATR